MSSFVSPSSSTSSSEPNDQLVALASITLVFFILAAPVVGFCAYKVAFARREGWYFLGLLTLIRIVGEPMTISVHGSLDFSNGVSIAGFVLSSVGLSPLLLASGGLITSFNQSIGSSNSRIPPPVTRLWILVPLVSLILSIIGIVDLTSSNPNTRQTGVSLRVAASALYLVTWGLLTFMAILSLPMAGYAERGPRVMMYAVIPTLPLLAVHTVYQGLSTFGSPESQSSNLHNIYERAFMASLMEFLTVIIYLAAGCSLAFGSSVPQSSYGRVQRQSEELELHGGKSVRSPNA